MPQKKKLLPAQAADFSRNVISKSLSPEPILEPVHKQQALGYLRPYGAASFVAAKNSSDMGRSRFFALNQRNYILEYDPIAEILIWQSSSNQCVKCST